jgi:NADPH-dependent glutamate synthase beta subunit-like oxidoreductase/NAD-dependent dihydropyrimidine dehydrogenase PreA subunit
VSKGALIIGSSPAGIRASLDLADAGIDVRLISSQPFLADDHCGLASGIISRARLLELVKHPRITLETNCRLEHAEGEPGSFQVTLRRQPRYVDLSKCTACGDCVEACPVTVPQTGHKAIYLREGLQPECAVIDKQGAAPCTSACPGGVSVQGYVALIAQGRFREALNLIADAIPFPGICGRVCTHPCENRCRRSEVDAPIAIRALKRFVADWALQQPDEDSVEKIPVAPDAARVAVVGSGPAGMTVADRLVRRGYRVTVFEKLPVIGGMMGIGIPAYRLPREVIAGEYRRIRRLGAEIRLNTAVGADGDETIDGLFQKGYRAVCLAIGAHSSLQLHISGEHLPGVVHGIELLKTISLSQQLDDPCYRRALDQWLRRGAATRAVVLGGGNTAMDAARSLKRLGLKEVRILYRRSRDEMPALPEEIADTEEEGIGIEFLTAPVRILGDEKKGVQSLECIRMKLAEPDASGRRRPLPISGSEFQLAVDLVVPAIGQVPAIDSSQEIRVNREGRIGLKASGFMTSRPGVFAAGDAVTSDKMAVIEAIGMGKQAAEEIDAFLKGPAIEAAKPAAPPLPVAKRELTVQEKIPRPRVAVPLLAIEKRLSGYHEVELGYTREQAMTEAGRCLACGPCSECLACVQVCKPQAVIHHQRASVIQNNVAAIIYAGEPDDGDPLAAVNRRGVYRVKSQSALEGSAAAAMAMFDLFGGRDLRSAAAEPILSAASARIGVFICRCGEEIAGALDTAALCERAGALPDVTTACELDFSCSPQGAQAIRKAVAAHGLNRVVLAACSCCSIDQVCYSCTYQRVRCKRNLGVFADRNGKQLPEPENSAEVGLAPGGFEFVNIREQCAWIHGDDFAEATAKAIAMVAAAVARARLPLQNPATPEAVDPSVLIIGNGQAAQSCRQVLSQQGIACAQLRQPPDRIRHSQGQYTVSNQRHTLKGTGLVLAPQNFDQKVRLLQTPGIGDFSTAARCREGSPEIQRPGIFWCDPEVESRLAGLAAAAQVTAWLGRTAVRAAGSWAVVDSDRCRACNTCVQTCEIGAVELRDEALRRFAVIDPAICTGCGSCVARCPSDAITLGYCTDAQLEAMLTAMLS